MNKKDLFELLRSSDKTPLVIKKKNSALFAKLQKKAISHIEALLSEYLKRGSKELQKYLTDFKLKIELRKKLDLSQQVINHLKRKKASEKVLKESRFFLDTVSLPNQLDDILNLKTPIKQNPLYIDELNQAKLYRVAGVTKLSDAKVKVALKKQTRVATLNDTKLKRLVKDRDLTDKEAKDLGLTVSLFRLLNENIELTEKLKKGTFANLPSVKVTNIKDLIYFEEADWLKLIKSTTSELPDELKPEQYARVLKRKIETLYPNDSLFTRIAPAKTIKVSQSIKKLAPLFKRNEKVFRKQGLDSLDLSGIDKRQIKSLKETYNVLLNLINMYPGLKLNEILNDKRLSSERKQEKLNKEIEYFAKFYKQNSDVNLLSLNYTPDSEDIKKLNFGGIPKNKQKAIHRILKAYQRIYFVTRNASDILKMMAAGYHSASEISDVSLKRFVKTIGLSEYQARRYFGTARSIESSAAAATAAVLDLRSGGFDQLQVSNLSPSIDDYLRKIDGYETLFGFQDYCKCKHCQSVLSPAAYFVDLMNFVEKYILKEPFSGDNADHVLNLKVRRPDLWRLPLTCENTHDIVPYLLIINEILENYIAIRGGYPEDLLYEPNRPPIGDRTAIEDFVYCPILSRSDSVDPFSIDTFRQPFVLPLIELITYLSHFKDKISQGDIARLLQEPEEVIARTSLQCSLKEYQLITKQNTRSNFHRKIYGYDFQVSGLGLVAVVDPVDVQELLKPMGLSRQELGDLIATYYVTARGAENVRIVSEKRDPNSIQNDIENLHGLKLYILDRMHRFTRLWKKLPWTIQELDLLLTHLQQNGLANGIDEQNTLRYIAKICRLQKKLNISVEQFCGLWSSKLPTQVLEPGKHSFFDRLFNLPDFVKLDGPYPKSSVDFIHPAFPVYSTRTTCIDGEPEGEKNMVVADITGFNDGDQVRITLDDGSLHTTTINGTPALNTIIIYDAIPADRTVPIDGSFVKLPEQTMLPDYNLQRLLAGLQIDDETLFQLILHLRSALSLDLNNAFKLTKENLTLLYRHAYIARSLNISVKEVFQLINNSDTISSDHVSNLSELESFIEFHEWFKSAFSNWFKTSMNKFDDLGFIINGVVNDDSSYPDPDKIANDIINQVEQDNAITFADTVFSFIEGITEEQSKDIIKHNPTVFDKVDNHYQLKDSYHPSVTLTIPFNRSVPVGSRIARLPIHKTRCTEGEPERETNIVVADITGFNDGDQVEITLDDGSLHTTTIDGAPSSNTIVITDKIPVNRSVPVGGRIAKLPIHKTTCTEGEPTGETNIVVADTSGFNDGDQVEITLDDGSLHTTTIDGAPSSNTIVITDGIPIIISEQVIREEYVRPYHPIEIIPTYLAQHLDISREKVIKLINMLNEKFTDSAFFKELKRKTTPPDKLKQLVGKLLPLSLLFKDNNFVELSLDFINDNPGLFNLPLTSGGQPDFTSLNTGIVKKTEIYRSFIKCDEDGTNNVADLTDVIGLFDSGQRKFVPGNIEDKDKIADIIGSEWGLIQTLQNSFSIPNTQLEALAKLRKAAEVARYLGVSGDALKLMVSDDYNDLKLASSAALGAFRAKYTDEKEWQERIEPFENQIRTKKRDALTDYLMHSIHPEFTSMNDLYHHFLIDVELEGCARTSRVVAAISSLQLYIHRVLMNLEQDSKDLTDPGKVHVILSDEEAREEWTWRKNYRVFEANRRIFLTPENWIEPELRDNKTPLFEELETELLQQDINVQTVLDAYVKYIRGFEEVANLKIAGAYHDVIPNEFDILHLIGVTPKEPPTYYYRKIENPIGNKQDRSVEISYSPWRKIDVQIPVKKVTPYVYRNRFYIFWTEYTTRSKNVITGGTSKFEGYLHNMFIKYIMLRMDGTWTTPQDVDLAHIDRFKHTKGGIIEDRFWEGNKPLWDYLTEHFEPRDRYTLSGFLFDRIYADYAGEYIGLQLTGAGYTFTESMNFYKNRLEGKYGAVSRAYNYWSKVLYSEKSSGESRKLYTIAQSSDEVSLRNYSIGPYARTSITIKKENIDTIKAYYRPDPTGPLKEGVDDKLEICGLYGVNELLLVNGSLNDCILQFDDDTLYLQGSITGDRNNYILQRLGTTIEEDVEEILTVYGIDCLLDFKTQESLKEKDRPIDFKLADTYPNLDKVNAGILDFMGPYGTYYREIFFHIPFLIANHLNSQQKFAEAQKWYHFIFNPTSSEVIDIPDPSLSLEEKEKLQRKRNWRYLEFRDLTLKTLRERLTDPVAIAEYKKNPFMPHAIARLRLSAYQKTIVMKYIDNLLDWGDHLFAQDTMESINEATLLYIMAADILGERPAELGECGEGKLHPKNYETIKPLLDEEEKNEFLIEMENYVLQNFEPSVSSGIVSYIYSLDPGINDMVSHIAHMEATASLEEKAAIFKGLDWSRANTSYWINKTGGVDQVADLEADSEATEELIEVKTNYKVFEPDMPKLIPVGPQLIKQISPVFCIPGNKQLLKYWDRVEDRLNKIRSCMNISGVRRELSLFAPEIDPGLLVRARAAGLSLEEILDSISGDLPPYRFSYLIEKAKNYANIVQGFGTALLSALEKKDVEELNRLRTLHEQNTLKLTTEIKQKEIDAAKETIESLNKQKAIVEYRRDYYQGLIDDGLTEWEVTQQISKHIGTGLKLAESIVHLQAAITYLIPQVGSPFAMKYGGQELGHSGVEFAQWTSSLAAIADAVSASAGLEASFSRREQEWKFQKDTPDKELLKIDKEKIIAEIRMEIAQKSKEIHEETIKQSKEVFDFYGDKFSNFGLYTWLSTQLHRLFRDAYNCAFSMAKLAEQAYRFERSDDTSNLLNSNYWEASKAGLMAGERLMIDLLNLEKRYIETNYRSLEINQSFSLTQVNPAALIKLKATGECNFEIPEIYFDLFYPGHYRRRIKSVRLSIPCITGPYTNISAQLTLLDSWIRKDPKTDSTALKSVPKMRTTSVATSSAQNDGGVFELNFRDERLIPFEGAGAISRWKISLPKSFKQFDYQTINDVIIHLSYTAEHDSDLRDTVENMSGTLEGSILNFLQDPNNHLQRVFSLRHEFSNEFHRILHSPIGQDVKIKIDDRHFPIFLTGKTLRIDKGKLVLVSRKDQSVANFDISINPTSTNPNSQTGFTADPQLGDLPSVDITSILTSGVIGDHNFIVNNAGDLSPDSPAPGDQSAIDSEKLTDILLYVEYGIISIG